MRQSMLILAVVGFVAACTDYTLVSSARHSFGDAFSIEPQIEWSKITAGGLELWTVDGPLLAAIYFAAGLEDGEALFQVGKKEDRPTFRTQMTAFEVAEFVTNSLAFAGASGVDSLNLRPIEFGEIQGFRFELSYRTADGLEQGGIAAGAIRDGKLYLILYRGTRQYYFEKYRTEVERIIDSVEM